MRVPRLMFTVRRLDGRIRRIRQIGRGGWLAEPLSRFHSETNGHLEMSAKCPYRVRNAACESAGTNSRHSVCSPQEQRRCRLHPPSSATFLSWSAGVTIRVCQSHRERENVY